jgi:hypothetical protein
MGVEEALRRHGETSKRVDRKRRGGRGEDGIGAEVRRGKGDGLAHPLQHFRHAFEDDPRLRQRRGRGLATGKILCAGLSFLTG